MSFITVYIHFTWVTKGRNPLLKNPAIRLLMWKHIKEYAESKGIKIDCVNGYSDHCHCLVSMNGTISISEVARMLKGESSFWINNQKILDETFSWQKEFYAASVSNDHLFATRQYIHNQEVHHSVNTDNIDFVLTTESQQLE